MSRKRWVVFFSAVMLAVLLAGAAAAAFYLIPRYRSARSLAQAREFAAKGDREMSRRYYQEYLYQNDEDIPALGEYIALCEQIVSDRRRSLLAAGRAYMKLVQNEPDEPARKTAVLDFYRKHLFWQELESAIVLFYGPDRDSLSDEIAYEKAVAGQEQGRDGAAIEAFESYLGFGQSPRKDAPPRDVPLRLARVYAKAGREGDAAALFENLASSHPDAPLFPVYYAGYLMDQNKTELAAAQLARVPEASRGAQDYLLAAARLANSQGEYGKAVELSRQAVEKDPGNVDAHLNYLLSLERNGARDQAMAYIENLDPLFRVDTPGFLMFLIELKLSQSDFDGADAALQSFAVAYPDQKSLNEYLKGRVTLSRGDSEGNEDLKKEARDQFAVAVEMNPNLDRARYFLAIAELELNNEKAARTPLEIYLRNNPQDGQARRLWTRYYDTAKSLLELRYAADRILKETSPDVESLFFTIQDLSAQHREEDQDLVRQLMEKAIKLAPADPRGYRALAAYYLERDALEKAEGILADAAAAGIDRSTFSLLDSSILLARGESEKALDTVKASLAAADIDEVKTWATFFARNGHYAEGDALLQMFAAQPELGQTAGDVYAFRLSLALRFNSLDDARKRLEEGEAALAGKTTELKTLNEMRITMAQALLATPAPAGKRTGEVLALLDRIQSSDPSEEGVKLVLARLALAEDLPDFNRARNLASGIPESAVAYDSALLLLAEIAAKQGQYDLVAKWAGKALERSARNTAALYMLGQAQLEMRDRDGARKSLERILDIDRGDIRALSALVRLYTDLQLPQLAQQMLARYEKQVAGTGTGGLEELRTYASGPAADLSGSEAKLREELAAGPDNFTAVAGLVRSLVEQGKYEDGKAELNAYLARHPNDVEPWVFLGQIILDRGPGKDLAEASTAFTRAQIIVPEYGPAQLGLIDVQTRMNNIELAISLCRRYLKSHAGSADALFRLAGLLSRNPARQPEALETVQRAIETEGRPEFIRLRAFLYTSLGRYDDAVADLERLKSLTNETIPDDDLTLAEAYLGKTDLENARRYLTLAKSKIPQDNARLLARANRVEALLDTPGAGH